MVSTAKWWSCEDVEYFWDYEAGNRGSIILKMRNTFTLIRDSLLEFVKKSTDSTDSASHEESDAQANFYKQFLESSQSLQCQIKTVERVPRVIFQRSYALYVVQVRCQLLHFQVKKRYSEFEQFYQRCRRRCKVSTPFPPRTILQPGWSQDVTNLRTVQLNALLRQITGNNNIGVQLQLYSFLGLYNQCKHLQVGDKQCSLEGTDEFLLQQLSKLNQFPTNMLEGLQRMQQSLGERKKRLGFEMSRLLLIGGEEQQGLLEIVMANSNELVVAEGLQLLNWLLSAETNRDYQAFRRVLAKCPPNKLVLKCEEVRNHSNVGAAYFKLLKYYLSNRQEEDLQQVGKCYEQGEHFVEDYGRWLKYSSMDSA